MGRPTFKEVHEIMGTFFDIMGPDRTVKFIYELLDGGKDEGEMIELGKRLMDEYAKLP